MGRSPLFRRVRTLLRRAHANNVAAGISPGQPPAAGPSRRGFLESLGALAAVPVLGPALAGCGDDGDGDGGREVAIIGGGIAGLTAAHFLAEAGVRATVYEGSMRVGGRMFTQRGLAGGQLVELGGELVDSDHVVVPTLCQTFGLALDDLVDATPGLTQDAFHFNGAFLTETEIVDLFTPVAAVMDAAIALGEQDDAEFERIDALSIPAYLEQECGLAAGSVIRELLEVAYLEEYGLEVAEQSAWNLLYLIDAAEPEPFRVFGSSDERFHIHEGSDALTTAIAGGIEGQIELDHRLTTVATDGDRFTLTFDNGTVVTVDHVLYALPFTKLREVNLDAAGLSAEKREVITEIGYGTNAKLMMQFTDRHWETAHTSSGSLITDIGQLQALWATSRGQAGTQGILTNFVGGARGVDIGTGTPESQAATVLPWIDTAFPGTAAKYVAGSAVRQHWPSYEYSKGSYACYRVGQWAYYGLEGAREGNQHFCGEHCSADYQGYMEGAAETGALAASEILTDLEITAGATLEALLGVLGGARTWTAYHGGFRRGSSNFRRRGRVRR